MGVRSTTTPSRPAPASSGAQERSRATSTGSRSSSGKCTATPGSTCSATASSSPPDDEGTVTITTWGSDPLRRRQDRLPPPVELRSGRGQRQPAQGPQAANVRPRRVRPAPPPRHPHHLTTRGQSRSRHGGQIHYDAVKTGSRLQWSSGAVEGNVNRLKVLKRQMYGHAGFDLLR